MLKVKTPQEVLEMINSEFAPIEMASELVSLDKAVGRVLS